MAPSACRSTMEEMLEAMKRHDELPKDVPPTLPSRPTSKGRLPSYLSMRRSLPSGNPFTTAGKACSATKMHRTGSVMPTAKVSPESRIHRANSTGTVDVSKAVSVEVRQAADNLPGVNGGGNGDVKKSEARTPRKLSGFVESMALKWEEAKHSPHELSSVFEASDKASLFKAEPEELKASFVELWRFSFLDSPYDSIDQQYLHPGEADTVRGLKENCSVWCKSLDEKWALGVLHSLDGTDSVVSIPDAQNVKVPVCDLLPANPDFLEGADDLVQLSYLNEPSVLHNIQQRFKNDLIYTKAGPILLAVNPFKDMSVYGDEFIKSYKCKAKNRPHVYSVADAAFEAMLAEDKNQSIIVSGESGAGKTSTANHALRYLVERGGNETGDNILKANLILESFGNAKTLKNVNSTRFEKLIDLSFTDKGKICGAEIQACILDKSRIVQRQQGERSYHLFYQLCACDNSSLREQLHLETADKFSYLQNSRCLYIENVDDKKSFRLLVEALTALQISKEDQDKAFQIISAILWLGNIIFIDSDSVTNANSRTAVNIASKLLGFPSDELMKTLSTRKIDGSTGTVEQKLTPLQASAKRDSLAQALYGNVFEWMLDLINKSLHFQSSGICRSISILDMYGFESLKKNGFDQLLINYANERLRQHMQRHLLELEKEDCLLEGINWVNLKLGGNYECSDVIEKKSTGLFSLLDEESAVSERTDVTLSIKLKQQLKAFPCFKGESGKCFSIDHSSGKVTYDTGGFLEKNRGFMHLDLLQLLSSSNFELTRMFASKISNEARDFTMVVSSANCADSRKPTFVTKFKGQLFKILWHIERTSPHFIWCIKPNRLQNAGVFEADYVLQQFRYWGLMDVIHNYRVGYPSRLTFDQFLKRYRFLLCGDERYYGTVHACIAVLQKCGISPDMYHVGFSKLFLRAGQVDRLETVRLKTLSGMISVQKVFRGYRERCHFYKLKKSTVLIQAYVRCEQVRKEYHEQVRKEYHELRNRNVAAVIFQKNYRCRRERTRYLRTLEMVTRMQAGIRGWLMRRQNKIKASVSKGPSPDGLLKLAVDRPRIENGEWRTEVAVPTPSVFASDTHKHILLDTRLREKEEENAVLRQRLQTMESNWVEYEHKMKSMEEMWQKQIFSLQASLATEKLKPAAPESAHHQTCEESGNFRPNVPRPLATRQNMPSDHMEFDWEEAASVGVRTPEHSFLPRRPSAHSDTGMYKDFDRGKSAVISLVKEFENRAQVFTDDANFIVEVKSGQVDANLDPDEEFRNLKVRFDAFKKNFKTRLRETKTLLHKLKHKDLSTKTKRKWWIMKSH